MKGTTLRDRELVNIRKNDTTLRKHIRLILDDRAFQRSLKRLLRRPVPVFQTDDI